MTTSSDVGPVERALLGSILLDNSVLRRAEAPRVEDFSLESNRRIYRQMLAMAEAGRPIDLVTLTFELSAVNLLESCGGPGYVASLVEDVVPENAPAYARHIREAAQERRYSHLLESLSQSTKADDRLAKLEQMRDVLSHEDSDRAGELIRKFADIPDIASMEIPTAEYLVPALGIARNTITLWTGPDGDGKTYLAQDMAVAVARGDTFLGMSCQQSPVLYLDLENPGYAAQERVQALLEDGTTPANIRFWGTWLEQQPPQSGSELLLAICKEVQPLLVVDPFRYFHNAEENDSTEMAGVMQYLRACAACGAAVVILHHPAKTEGSTGRGSSAIRGACDLAFLHTLDKESGLITIKVDKNRLGPSRTITVRADFEEGKFELTEAPYVTRRNDELDRVQQIIEANPGITQNAISKQSGMKKTRLIRLLNEGIGARWRTENGKHGSICYFGCSLTCSKTAKSLFPKAGTAGTGTAKPTSKQTCSPVPSLLEGNREQVCDGPKDFQTKNLPSCTRCGSFAIYEDGECPTCAGRA